MTTNQTILDVINNVTVRDGDAEADSLSTCYLTIRQTLDGTLPEGTGLRVEWTPAGRGSQEWARRLLDGLDPEIAEAHFAAACRGTLAR